MLRQKVAAWTIRNRFLVGIGFLFITLFFSLGLPEVKFQTIFSELLPNNDPYVQIYRDHPNFGSPLTMFVMVRHKHGDIYNVKTINKVWQLTRDIDLAPAVNHDQILSISTTKARYAQATPNGIDMRPLMGDSPPSNAAELADFASRVDRANNVSRFLISRDESATIISAKFIEHQLDYGKTFEYLQSLVEAARDADHEVHLAGQPALTGWVYRYEWQMAGIFSLTLLFLVFALLLYMKSWSGVITPIICGTIAAIWAFGLAGLFKVSIEPLLMIVPLLLIARSFSHCVQFIERFNEIYAQTESREKAAELTMSVMMAPSIISILTDILGIIVVIAAPIDAMVRHAIFCGMWALFLIPTGVFLAPILLTLLPPPREVKHGAATDPAIARQDFIGKSLSWIGRSVTSRHTASISVLILLVSAFIVNEANKIRIGNPVEGSSLLQEYSEFNTAVRAINGYFPGVNTLEIILEAKNPQDPNWTAQQAETVMTMTRLQRLMEESDFPPRASLSYADYLAETSRLFKGGNSKWLPLDPRQPAVTAASLGAMMGASAESYNHVISEDMQHATVSFWYADNKQSTIDQALATAGKVVDIIEPDHANFSIRLGTGVIALQQAVNNVVEQFHLLVLLLLNCSIFLMCSIAYRSFTAGFILLIPVNLANFAMLAAMHRLGVGLDVNSMIVAAIGLGVGIDYGIYLLSRICQEHDSAASQWQTTISASITTTGRAIFFTASMMAIGILPWTVLSELKFVADMGLLLVVIMGINMLLALYVLPFLVWVIKPRFISKSNLLSRNVSGFTVTSNT